MPGVARRFRPPTDICDFAILALAAHRLTRLLTTDEFPPVARLRAQAETWALKNHPAWAEGLTCPWCLGWHVSVAVGLAAWRWPVARRLALIPALSSVVGLLSTLDSTLGRAFQPQPYVDPTEAVEYPRIVR